MIEKIYIPTVHRAESQIAFNSLPDELKKITVMVIQAWERPQYKYDCEYLILPDTDEYHYSNYYCLPKTRLKIYQSGRNMKYVVLDDDIIFGRRNAKYFGKSSNMQTSKRISTHDDIIEMFSLFDSWLDCPDVTVCGCSHVQFPPGKKSYSTNASLGGALWINGNHFSHVLDTFNLIDVRVAEDVNFLLTLLTNGYGNRVSQEFVFYNNSVLQSKKLKSAVWDKQTFEQTHHDHKLMEKKFPNIFNILYDNSGNRVSGGFRDYGKIKISWSKAYKKRNAKSFNDL